MVLDTSAIIAVLLFESGHERLTDKIVDTKVVVIGAPTVFETVMVLTARLGVDARPKILSFLRRMKVEVVPFSEAHMDAAIAAFIRFGRGHHPAKLNFGDCMSYAVASAAGMPLLFIGNDFSQTDIAQA